MDKIDYKIYWKNLYKDKIRLLRKIRYISDKEVNF